MDSLRKLPLNASYSAKSGQATAKVKRDDNYNVIVYASCDSLQRVVEWYQMKMSDYKKSNDLLKQQAEELKQAVSESHSNPIKMLLVVFIAGLITGVASTFLIIKRKK